MLIALHKNARTTPAVRAEIAASDERKSGVRRTRTYSTSDHMIVRDATASLLSCRGRW